MQQAAPSHAPNPVPKDRSASTQPHLGVALRARGKKRKEATTDGRQEADRAKVSSEGTSPSQDRTADSAADRRRQEDRLAQLVPDWWKRDPGLVRAEIRHLAAAGFRLRRREVTTFGDLRLLLEHHGARYFAHYPAGFPSAGVLAGHDWELAREHQTLALSSNAGSGAAVVALTDLLHRRRTEVDYPVVRFGVLLAGPWHKIHDGKGGQLHAYTAGRGTAVLPWISSGTAGDDALAIASAASELMSPFAQPVPGWWARGEAPDWQDGPEGIGDAIESMIRRQQHLTRTELRSPSRPLFGLVWPLWAGGPSHWLFVRRSTKAGWTFGRNEPVTAASFQVRAPYAEQLAGRRVTIVGCGSLGWPIAIGLARAGIRHFTLIDGDRLGAGNLARLGAGLGQTGDRKIEALREELQQVASGMEVITTPGLVGITVGARTIVADKPDLIIDAAADEATPPQTNAAAIALDVPAIYAWMTRGVRNARIFRMVPGRTPCYACVANAHPRSLVEERRSDALEFIWIGANFNIDPIAAAVVRMAVRTLARDPVDQANPDHVILRVGGPVPVAETLIFKRNPRCRWCGR